MARSSASARFTGTRSTTSIASIRGRWSATGVTFEPLMKSVRLPGAWPTRSAPTRPTGSSTPSSGWTGIPTGSATPQNRGKSKFVRISWDEATDLIAAEIKRVHKEYGPLSILVQGDGHGECKMIHAPHGCSTLLFDKMGGFTQQVRNPDSWEGWYWGSKHVWGKGFIGMMAPADNVVKDISENSDMVVVWGGDPETTHWGFRGQLASRLLYFWNQAGIKQVYICPDLNYSACIHADKWIPVLPNTDAALQLAIIYMWITEGTYDKEYVADPHGRLRQDRGVRAGRRGRYRPRRPSGPPRSAASPPGPSKRWPATGPRRSSPSATTSPAAWPADRTLTSPPAWSASSWVCRVWANRASIRRRSPTRACPRTSSPAARTTWVRSRTWSALPAGERILKPHRGTPTAWGKQMIPKTLIEEAIKKGTVDFWGTGGHEEPKRRPVQEVHLPHPQRRGRHRDPHDVDRHSLPADLLELRQRHRSDIPQSQDRMHRGPASLAGERLHLRRHRAAHQHHARGRRHLPVPARRRQLPERHQHAQGHRAGRRVQERLRGHRRGSQEAGHGRGHRGLLR